jgi:hypothetical protein
VRERSIAVAFVFAALVAVPSLAQTQMPNPKEISGQPLPSPELPAGTLSVRVIRGSFANNLTGQPVDVTVDGTPQTLKTDSGGRVQVSGLKSGAHVKATTVVDGERLDSQDIVIGATGIRVMLVATDPATSARELEDRRLAKGPAARGLVVFGPESRVITEMSEDRLHVYYLFDVLNTSRSPVDIGGPLFLELPSGARGASLMSDSTKQATVSGAHVTVLGPFPPGTTAVRVAFELAYTGGTAHITLKLPASLSQVIAIVSQVGGLDIVSSQVSTKREVEDQGERIIAALGPALQAGQTLSLDITGLPHHAEWPRYLALALAGSVMTAGIWGAVAAKPRRRAA